MQAQARICPTCKDDHSADVDCLQYAQRQNEMLSRRNAQLEAVAEADKAENLRLREALTMTKRLFCAAHLKVCQLHKVAEAAEAVAERLESDDDLEDGAADGVTVRQVLARDLRARLAALRDGGDDGK